VFTYGTFDLAILFFMVGKDTLINPNLIKGDDFD
jgi:hypothetical protein